MLTEAGTLKQAHVRGQMGAKWTVHVLVRELQAPPCGNRAPEGLLFGFFKKADEIQAFDFLVLATNPNENV